MTKLKVYDWQGWRPEAPAAPNGYRQTREVCAAPSMAALLRALKSRGRYTRKYMNDYGGVTEPEEYPDHEFVKTAMSEPGRIFWTPLDGRGGTRVWVGAEKIDE